MDRRRTAVLSPPALLNLWVVLRAQWFLTGGEVCEVIEGWNVRVGGWIRRTGVVEGPSGFPYSLGKGRVWARWDLRFEISNFRGRGWGNEINEDADRWVREMLWCK
jgi:hypothetical protein